MTTPTQNIISRIDTAIEALGQQVQLLELRLQESSEALACADLETTADDILFEKLEEGRVVQEDIWVAQQSISDLLALKAEVVASKMVAETWTDRAARMIDQASAPLQSLAA